jgi:C4-dicarboxylate transporter, DctM subunit
MDPIFIGLCGVVLLLLLVGVGIHIGIALAVTGILVMSFIMGFDNAMRMATSSMYFNNASYALVTLPLFVLMGLLGAAGGISKMLYDNLSIWTGKIRGSLGIATIIGCTAFGAVCGSSIVTAAVFAKVSAPEMRRHGYSKKIAYGLCASAGIIGMMIPPSILAVMYGILSGLSVGKLLLGGIGPGLMVAAVFSLWVYCVAVFRPDIIKPVELKKFTWKEKIRTIPSFWPVIVTALIIFGGIFGGIFSATEAAAVATVAILVLLVITKKRDSWIFLKEGLGETAYTSAMIFLTMGGACVFSRCLAITGLSQKVVELILNAHMSNLTFLIIMAIVYLILGCLMDSISMLTITIPILNPVIVPLGLDPYFFAVFVIYVGQIGIITPPFGLSVFTVKAVAEPDVSVEDVFSGSMPYFYALCVGIAILLIFPQIITVFTK